MTTDTIEDRGFVIEQAKRTETPRYGMAADGYTKRSGAPTSVMVRLAGEARWRRLMVWQFSNAGTCFLRIQGEPVIVPEHLIPNADSHDWQRGRLTGAVTCSRCGMLPVDDDDFETTCQGRADR